MFVKEEGRWQDCLRLVNEAEDKLWTLTTSNLTLAEACRRTGKGPIRDQKEQIEQFFEHSWILLVTIDRPLAIAARTMIFEHGLTSNDAFHLASAIRAGCDTLYTYDKHL